MSNWREQSTFSTICVSVSILDSSSFLCWISSFNLEDSIVGVCNFFLYVLRICCTLPSISLSLSRSWFFSSIFSRYCWFSIFSWLKSTSCRTSPISSFWNNKHTQFISMKKIHLLISMKYISQTCFSCMCSFLFWTFSVEFLSLNFSIVVS